MYQEEQAQHCNKLRLRRHLLHKRWAWPRRRASRWAFGPTRLFSLMPQFSHAKLNMTQHICRLLCLKLLRTGSEDPHRHEQEFLFYCIII